MQTSTRHPPIPPWVKISRCFGVFRPFRWISVCFGRYVYFGQNTFLGFFSLFFGSRLLSPLSFDLSTSPSLATASSFKPLTTWGNHRKKNKKFLSQFLSVLFSLVDDRQYREENDERNRRKTSKRKEDRIKNSVFFCSVFVVFLFFSFFIFFFFLHLSLSRFLIPRYD